MKKPPKSAEYIARIWHEGRARKKKSVDYLVYIWHRDKWTKVISFAERKMAEKYIAMKKKWATPHPQRYGIAKRVIVTSISEIEE